MDQEEDSLEQGMLEAAARRDLGNAYGQRGMGVYMCRGKWGRLHLWETGHSRVGGSTLLTSLLPLRNNSRGLQSC